jgi:hypothetical protein
MDLLFSQFNIMICNEGGGGEKTELTNKNKKAPSIINHNLTYC